MSRKLSALGVALCLLCLSASVFAQESCGTVNAPFLLSASETFCAVEEGPTVISFTIGNRNQPGTYFVQFPDGTDTTLTDVEGQIDVSRAFIFDCTNMPGRPIPPTAEDPFYAYQNQLSVTRLDCVDNLGQFSRASFDFNVVPNPVIDIENSGTNCIQEPFEITFSAIVCAPFLVSSYQWYVNDSIVEGATGQTLEGYTFDGPGDYVVRLDVTDFLDCGPFTYLDSINVTTGAIVDASFTVDSSDLCSPVVTLGTINTSRNATSFVWSSTSPDVTFSDTTAREPTITIDNTRAGTRVITLTASNEDCPPVSVDLPITTFDGQTINTGGPLVACNDVSAEFCDQISFVPEPTSVRWTASDPSVTVERDSTTCPRVLFDQAGNFDLTATGIDICGNPFSIDVPVRVRPAGTLRVDLSDVDTLCVTEEAINLMDYVRPRDNVRTIRGDGVNNDGSFFPANNEGLNRIEYVDSCGNVLPGEILVVGQGTFRGGNPVLCLGAQLDLGAIQAGTYSGPGVNGNTFNSNATGPGDFTISFTSTAFCGGSGQFRIRVVEFPVAAMDIGTRACASTEGGAAGRQYAGDRPVRFVNISGVRVVSYRVLETGEAIFDREEADFRFPGTGTYTVRQVVATGGGRCLDSTDLQVQIIAPFQAQYSFTVDSTGCDTVDIAFREVSETPDVSYRWTFSNGESSRLPNPRVSTLRPFQTGTFTAKVEATNGCFSQTDSFEIDLAIRFQASFDFLNDNSSVCSEADIFPVNTSTSFDRIEVTFPDGSIADELPEVINVVNTTEDILPYILRVEAFRGGCPSKVALDTIDVLPVQNRAAFSLAFDEPCSPAVVRLRNASTPGADDVVIWGDGSTPERIGSLAELTHTYRSPRDTSFTVTLISTQCGVDTFTRPVTVAGFPDADFAVFPDGGNCAGNSFTFRPLQDLTGFELDWSFGDGRFSAEASPRYRYDEAGRYMAYLTVTDTEGCTATDSLEVEVDEYNGPPLRVNFPPPVCVGSPIDIDIINAGGELTYDYGNGLISSDPVEFPYSRAGDFVMTVSVKDEAGCRKDTSGLMSILPEFEVVILPDVPDTTIELGDNAPLGFDVLPARNLDSILWTGESISDPNARFMVASPLEDALYQVEVTDEFGCQATDSILVLVAKDLDKRIFIPNAFSPDGDGVNDYFKVFAKPNTVNVINYLRVFNRWGGQLYECLGCQPDNLEHRWDGKLDGQFLNPAVLVWTAEIEFIDGSTKIFFGDVTLMR